MVLFNTLPVQKVSWNVMALPVLPAFFCGRPRNPKNDELAVELVSVNGR